MMSKQHIKKRNLVTIAFLLVFCLVIRKALEEILQSSAPRKTLVMMAICTLDTNVFIYCFVVAVLCFF